jgi:hypothetical protein
MLPVEHPQQLVKAELPGLPEHPRELADPPAGLDVGVAVVVDGHHSVCIPYYLLRSWMLL